RAVLRRVAFIKAGGAAGVPLERMREALASLPAHRAPSARDWERLSERWRADLDERIESLQALRDRLSTCIGCGCLSLEACGLLNPEDEAGDDGAGARYLRAASPRSTTAMSRPDSPPRGSRSHASTIRSKSTSS
ncbi:MAG: redox-sensitive transcriptional activator SoxR, partial [Solirubrobacteraceae bacterium]